MSIMLTRIRYHTYFVGLEFSTELINIVRKQSISQSRSGGGQVPKFHVPVDWKSGSLEFVLRKGGRGKGGREGLWLFSSTLRLLQESALRLLPSLPPFFRVDACCLFFFAVDEGALMHFSVHILL